MKFIDKIADHLLKNYADSFENICVVLPNKRAGLFLKNSLKEKFSNKSFFIPKIFSIEEYIYSMSELTKAEEISLISTLYKSYVATMGSDSYEFDKFYSMGKIILNDFNDVDDNMANAKDVFINIFEAKEIEELLYNKVENNKFLFFYKSLEKIYERFTQDLLDNSLAYRGLASRKLAENDKNSPAFSFSKVIFAGLNAISPSFEKHIDLLLQDNKADLIWDADPMYFSDENFGAGHFLKKAKIKWPNTFDENQQSFFEQDKHFDFIGTPFRLTQILTGLNLLTEKIEKGEKDILLVLADENMLPQLMNCLPENLSEKVNISMGMPMSCSLCGQLIKNLLTLHLNPFINNSDIVDANTFYYNDVIQLISNPFFKFLIKPENQKNFLSLKSELLTYERKLLKIDHKLINSDPDNKSCNQCFTELSNICENIFESWKTWGSIIDICKTLCEKIFNNTINDNKLFIEKESAWKLFTSLNSIENSFEAIKDSIDLNIRVIADFIVRYINSARVPLSGEPLKGVQILGLLETRAIDFENVIIIGVNEGFLPANSKKDTLIPFDFRINLGLPMPIDTEAVYDYHFYRLIQRAKNITLIYNSENDILSGKEPSRYIAQIKYHISKLHPNIEFTEKIASINYETSAFSNYKLPPKEILHEKLTSIYKKNSLSFSALYNFMSCPFSFALKYLLGIKEETIDSLQIPANELGNIFHDAINNTFSKYINKNFDESIKSEIINEENIEQIFQNCVKKRKISDFDYGYKFLQLDIVKECFHRHLTKFVSKAIDEKIIILDSEKEYTYDIKINKGNTIKLKGIIDRVESDGKFRYILDFKTTKKEPLLKIDNIENFNFDIDKHQYLLQLLFYSLLYVRNTNLKENILAGNYIVFKEENANPFFITENTKTFEISNEFLNKFEEYILEQVNILFDENNSFEPNVGCKQCEYCPYKEHLCFHNVEEAQDN